MLYLLLAIAALVLAAAAATLWPGVNLARSCADRLPSARGLLPVGTAAALTHADIDGLPPPAQRYLQRVGAIGQPPVNRFHVVCDAEMFQAPGGAGMKGVAEQFDQVQPPRRLFLMRSQKAEVPVAVLHDDVGHQASMQVRIASLWNVVNRRSDVLAKVETVTFLNGLCLFAPSALAGACPRAAKPSGTRHKARLCMVGLLCAACGSMSERRRCLPEQWLSMRSNVVGHCGWFLMLLMLTVPAVAAPLDEPTINRIDAFVAEQAQASGIPGVAIAVLQEGREPHVRGFGHDGRGHAITADTPFPIGSLTKSFTALLVRQAVDASLLDADAPVQRYLPWFRVTDSEASKRITLRHLLNQTSGFSRADGITPLLAGSHAGIEELARGLSTVSLNRPVGERFEYSNLNYVLLAAVLQSATGRSWRELMQQRVLRPLAMTHSHVDHDAAQRDGLTQVHQFIFGLPLARKTPWLTAFEPTGGLVASANDMARYLHMLLAGGRAPSGQVVSAQGVAQLLAPASPPAHTTLLSADFDFRYGQGWFVGPFGSSGAAADARWHLGSLTSFAAWMVLLPDTKQAVVVLINANSELPIGNVNAVMSRLPIGIVNLLRGQAPPQGVSLRVASAKFTAVAVLALTVVALLAWWAARARRAWGGIATALVGVTLVGATIAAGLGPSLLWAFAPEVALVLAVAVLLLCLPLAMRWFKA